MWLCSNMSCPRSIKKIVLDYENYGMAAATPTLNKCTKTETSQDVSSIYSHNVMKSFFYIQYFKMSLIYIVKAI